MKRAPAIAIAFALAVTQVSFGAAAAATAPTDTGVSDVPASGSGSSVWVRADGWIEYPSVLTRAGVSKASLASATAAKVQLDRAGDMCVDGSSKGMVEAPRGKVVYTEETAYNPANCVVEVTTTALVPADVALVRSAIGDHSAFPGLAPASGRGYGNMSSSWIDPVDITIASQSLYLSWLTATGAPYTYEPHRYGFSAWIPFLTPPGIGGVNDVTYLTNSSASVVGNKYKATANFRNDTFYWWVFFSFGPVGAAACLNPSSNVAYFNFEDQIWGSGSTVYGSWNDTRSGACTNLVHHGSLVAQGWPT